VVPARLTPILPNKHKEVTQAARTNN